MELADATRALMTVAFPSGLSRGSGEIAEASSGDPLLRHSSGTRFMIAFRKKCMMWHRHSRPESQLTRQCGREAGVGGENPGAPFCRLSQRGIGCDSRSLSRLHRPRPSLHQIVFSVPFLSFPITSPTGQTRPPEPQLYGRGAGIDCSV